MGLIVLKKITGMFLILFLGVLCYRKNFFDDNMISKLSGFLLTVVNPLVIFVSYQIEYDPALLRNLLITLALAGGSFAVQIITVHLIVPQKGNADADIERLSTIYGNCGFIGIPLINSLYGREGVFYMTAYLTMFYLFFWTHGVIIMAGKTDIKTTLKKLLSPAIIGVMLGLVCFVAKIRFPEVIISPMDSVGSMNTPLAMLVAGATLAQSDVSSCFGKRRTYWVTFLKLILTPLIVIVILLPFHVALEIAVTLIIAAGCPVGACCTMFALKYKNDGRYASSLFVVSTLFSVITIPLLILLTEQFIRL